MIFHPETCVEYLR